MPAFNWLITLRLPDDSALDAPGYVYLRTTTERNARAMLAVFEGLGWSAEATYSPISPKKQRIVNAVANPFPRKRDR